MPIDGRATTLSAFAAAEALLAGPMATLAGSPDAELFAAIAHVKMLNEVREAANDCAVREWEGVSSTKRDLSAIEKAQAVLDQAVTELSEAQKVLLAVKPQTIAGNRAKLATLLETITFDGSPMAKALVQFLLEAPACPADGRKGVAY